jgi:transporter family protein
MAMELTSVALAVGAMLCLGLSDFLNKRAMRAGIQRTQFLVVQSVFFTLATLSFTVPVGFDASPYLAYAVVCGAITFVSYVFVLKALEVGDASVAVPVYRMSFGVTVVMAMVILGEDLTVRRVLGFVFIVLALVTLTAINGREREDDYQSSEGIPIGASRRMVRSAKLAAALAAVAMVTIGTKGFLYKVGVSEGVHPYSFALVQSLTFLPIAVAYMWWMDGGLRFERPVLGHAPLNGILTAMASVLLLLSLIDGDASVSVPISQLCFVVTAILAMIIFRERLTAMKVLGIVSAVVAVLVLSSGLPLPWGL